jgi:hypothetical protein
MPPTSHDGPGPVREPGQVVGPAIQNLAAARLGRAFFPLALLLLLGLARVATEGGTVPFLLALGAPLSGGVMLAFGQRVVRRAFGHPWRRWMKWAGVAGVLPPVYAIWVMAWLGLKGLAGGWSVTGTAMAVASALLGLWALRSWLRIVELQRLAEAMAMDPGVGDQEEV